MRVLLLGGGAREHCIAKALHDSRDVELYAIAHNPNPGILRLTGVDRFAKRSERDSAWIVDWARAHGIEMAVIGLEDPLDVGLPDALLEAGIPTVGPGRVAAQLETSKIFLRELMKRHQLPGAIEYHYFDDGDALERFLRGSKSEYALKPIGLTAGKGVRVMGEQLATIAEAVEYGRKVIADGYGNAHALVVEERLRGSEFTLQCFVDGHSIVPMPLVQDYKKAFEGELGPNTGSMGSYSQEDGLLPFLTEADYDSALEVLNSIVRSLSEEGVLYKGIMYGQFMATQRGPRLIEINARFGDPEAVNVLPLLETDFASVCRAIIDGTLADLDVSFRPFATVCKYVTPSGYGVAPEAGKPLKVDEDAINALGVRLYFAKVSEKEPGCFLTTDSRSFALVGIAPTVTQAEARVEEALKFITGKFHVRHDIGTPALLNRWRDVLSPSLTS